MKAWQVSNEEDGNHTWFVAAETAHDACIEALKEMGWQVSAEPLSDKFVCSGCGIVCEIEDHARAGEGVCDNCTEKDMEATPAEGEDDDEQEDA